MEDKRYFGEPFKAKNLNTKDYVDIIEPNADGTQTFRTEFQSYTGKLNHSVNSIFNDPTSESELIQNYREISDHQDVDFAIEEIVNEIFVTDGESEPITLDLDVLDDLPNSKKKEIQEEFQSILGMLNFNRDAFEIFKRFYIDSRLYYYKVVNPQNLKDGIQELRYIDPMSIRKVKEVITKNTQNAQNQQIKDIVDTKEYFIYTPQNNLYSNNGNNNNFGSLNSESMKGILGNSTANVFQLNSYAVAYVHSGLFDHQRNCVKGHLHKVTKPLNDLLNLETHMIIYRVARAPERRVFYIDTGQLPPNKAQQYINLVQDSYRREINYDTTSGKLNSDSKTLSMHEDFWLPRSANGKGTEVDTLQGASNLSQIEDIEYMDKKFKTSLNIPISRFDRENVSTLFGGNTEMSRDEIKFQKFIGRLRARFNGLFRDILGTQLILKEILTSEEWFEIENRIAFDYIKDTYLTESRKFAVLEKKAEVVKSLDELVGRYFSREYVWKEILGFSDEEIEIEIAKMEEEAKKFKVEDEF